MPGPESAMQPHTPRPATTSWPIRLYLAAAAFAFLTLSVFTPTLSGAAINEARLRTQAGIVLFFVLRLLWAVHRKEQGRGWRVYVASLLLSVPVWLLIEPWFFAMWRRGR